MPQYFDPSQFAFPATNCLPIVVAPAAACDSALAPGAFFGNVGRNVMISPGIANVDFTLTKETRLSPLGEAGMLQSRAEFLNTLNRANFGTPSSSIFDQNGRLNSSAGQITETQNHFTADPIRPKVAFLISRDLHLRNQISGIRKRKFRRT